MKVLVVDDSGAMRKYVIAALSSIPGFTHFDEAEDGKKALEAARTQNYDLIMMDWNMPALSGLDAVIAMRSLGINTPIIMATTNAEKKQVVNALKAGANDYVIKPFTHELLAAKCRKTLSINFPPPENKIPTPESNEEEQKETETQEMEKKESA
ncbi:MAG: response regulator [Candidatus Omnitrophota bacterium]